MRKGIALVIFAAACSSSSSGHKLPSATLTPHLDARDSAVACGDDIALNGNATPDARYTYAFDGNGVVVHADGVFTAGGPNDAIDYTYDADYNLTHVVETHGFGDSQSEILAAYDPTNGLTDYTWSWAQGGSSDAWDYALSNFVAPFQPATETITEQGGTPFNYNLTWDADGRLTGYTDDAGDVTTYTYDDAAGTITLDTNSGAFTGTITYDADDHLLSEVYGGSDANAWASQSVYTWNGDQLLSVQFSSGTEAAPKTLALVEVDTIRYDCANAKTGVTAKFIHPSMKR